MTRLPSVCVIGAGSSGLPVVKALRDRGIPVSCFDKSDRVGGNWVFRNKNGMSSAYRSLHINSSRYQTQYADYPMPADYPDFPHHSLIATYFERYARHFGLHEHITFETGVERAELLPDRTWRITLSTGEVGRYDALVVANGHHWDPLWPDPSFPGHFDGHVMHSHYYIDSSEPYDFHGKRVVIVGMGNSALDLACELGTPGIAERVFLSVRRGVYIVPHYIFGKPLDQGLKLPTWMPIPWRMRVGTRVLRMAAGRLAAYGLPEPDHLLGQTHPAVSSEIFTKLGSGAVTPKPNIRQLLGKQVEFADGSTEDIDAIVYCTGYRVSFPFFDPAFLAAADNDLPLFRRVYRPDIESLFFIGLLQPLGAIMPIAEAQAKWIAEYLCGEYALPAEVDMRRDMARERLAMFRRYVRSSRHTMQVDFHDYMEALAAERDAGRKRARQRGGALPVAARAAQPRGSTSWCTSR